MADSSGAGLGHRDLMEEALAAHRAGRLDAAERIYRQILALAPQDHNALTNLGTVALQRGQLAQSVELIEASLAVWPDQSNALNNLGHALLSLGRCEPALAALDRALGLDPQNPDALGNRGEALRRLGRLEEAAQAYEQALQARPDSRKWLIGLGVTMEALGRSEAALALYERALADYDRALALSPGNAEILCNRAVALQALLRLDEAMADYDRALVAAPDDARLHFHRALLRLMRGDYREGWREYEWRWRWPVFLRRGVLPGLPAGPKWLGETNLAGKRLLIVCEQGFGDTIQMLRYAPRVKAEGGEVVAIVKPPLAELARGVEGVTEVPNGGEPVSYDFWTPMMSLPLAFGTTLESVPDQVPYLRAPAEQRAAWAARLGARRRPRVGLVWSGQAGNANDANRSLPLASLAPILEAEAEFMSLQTEYRDADRAWLTADGRIADWSRELRSFSDTAGLIEALDLVIAVDTSVAHLAGALGKPVLVLLPFVPDWRWGLSSDRTPWYPTARLLRQPARGDWSPVVAAALAEVRKLTR